MTRFEHIKAMPIREMAKEIVSIVGNDDFCKGYCDPSYNDCPHEIECCVRWLQEEMEGNND